MSKYVVRVDRCDRGSPEVFSDFLVAIRYDRYQTGERVAHSSSVSRHAAFKFETLEAAEFAAVFVGGRVEPA